MLGHNVAFMWNGKVGQRLVGMTHRFPIRLAAHDHSYEGRWRRFRTHSQISHFRSQIPDLRSQISDLRPQIPILTHPNGYSVLGLFSSLISSLLGFCAPGTSVPGTNWSA